MQTTEALLGLLRERGKRGLPLKRIYRQLYNTNLYLTAYVVVSPATPPSEPCKIRSV